MTRPSTTTFPATFGMAFDPVSGTVYASDVGTDELLTVDPLTGAGTIVGPTGINKLESIAFDPTTSTLFGVNQESDPGGDAVEEDVLVTVNTSTGATTVVGATGFDFIRSLTVDPSTGTLYAADTETDQLLTLDKTTGAGTVVGAFGFGNVSGIAFSPFTGTLYGVDNGVDSLLTIDPLTGVATEILPRGSLAADGATRIEGFVVIPEPASVALLALGAVGVLGRRRRR